MSPSPVYNNHIAFRSPRQAFFFFKGNVTEYNIAVPAGGYLRGSEKKKEAGKRDRERERKTGGGETESANQTNCILEFRGCACMFL